jgi:hypothetical protein
VEEGVGDGDAAPDLRDSADFVRVFDVYLKEEGGTWRSTVADIRGEGGCGVVLPLRRKEGMRGIAKTLE